MSITPDANKRLAHGFFDVATVERLGPLMTDDATRWITLSTPVSGLYRKRDFLETAPTFSAPHP